MRMGWERSAADAMSYNYLTIYRTAERDEFLAAARTAPPFFDRATRAWIVADPALCKDVLTSPALYPAPALEQYRNMPSAFGEQLSSMAFAFENLPLGMYGERHAQERRRNSEFLATRRRAIHAWVADEMPRHLDRFAHGGRLEVARDVIKPMVRGLIATMIDIDLPDHLALDDISKVFDKGISMQRRLRLEADMAALEAHLRGRIGPDADDADIGMRIGLVIMGKEATVGTLAESLVSLFRANEGQPLSQMAFPKLPHETAVPFVERIAASPVEIGGMSLAEGDRVRVVLQTYAHSPAGEHHRFFGSGAHACLGRPLSTELWTAMVAHLSKLGSRVHVLDYELAQDSFVFNAPKVFEVEVTSD
jgi:cytochrome P450